MAQEESSTPQQQVRRLYEDAEARTASAMEDLVGRPSFGELLARMTENVVAVTRMGNDAFDLLVRNLRLAGRQDVTRLSRQLARTEDKLEMVLQEVERLQERLDGRAPDDARAASRSSSAAARSSASGSSNSASGSRGGSRSGGGGRSGDGGGSSGSSGRGRSGRRSKTPS
jgi:5'-deoxynucleotidase YfbR-like HD superfamily hydrolase